MIVCRISLRNIVLFPWYFLRLCICLTVMSRCPSSLMQSHLLALLVVSLMNLLFIMSLLISCKCFPLWISYLLCLFWFTVSVIIAFAWLHGALAHTPYRNKKACMISFIYSAQCWWFTNLNLTGYESCTFFYRFTMLLQLKEFNFLKR
jgi:hypothetical protein